MSDEVFGRPIKEADADKIFDRFMNIKRRCCSKFQEVLANDAEALRYYCGRPGKDPMEEDWAFVFSRESLDHLIKNMDELGADGIFVFYGAKGADDAEPSGNDPDMNGRPTLMMFPSKYHEVEDQMAVEFELFKDRGIQYPGTGGDTLPAKGPAAIPVSFTKGKYYV